MFLPPQVPDEPFTWAQAQAAGLTRRQLTELVECGRVRRVLQGVYQPSELPDTVFTRARAAFRVVRPFSVLCDRTAGWLHGVDTFAIRELNCLPPLETYVLRNHCRIRRHGLVGGERDLADGDVIELHGVRVTTPVRTAMDLACRLSRRDALAALDGFMRAHGLTAADLRAELPRYRRRRGVVQLRRLIPLADARSESPGESWTRMAIIDAGLPLPEPQYTVREHGRQIYRLDLAYPDQLVCVEYDGREFHESAASREHDRRRRAWLMRRGWTVIVLDKESFHALAVAQWTEELRQALNSAARS